MSMNITRDPLKPLGEKCLRDNQACIQKKKKKFEINNTSSLLTPDAQLCKTTLKMVT
jgi:hypothetical protein